MACAKWSVALPVAQWVALAQAGHGRENNRRGTIMTTQPTPKGAWKITFLLFLFMLVNFADKIVVGLAGVPIMNDLKIQPEQFGFLGSSFFFLYSIAAIVVGFIVNCVATRWVLLVLAAIWALAQFPMVGTIGFSTLLICRIILGAGEGPAAAVAVHAIYKWFPDEKRTLPTAILSQGSAFGVILAVPALNWLIVHYSWHYAFGALGVLGLMWVVAWMILGKEGPLVQTVAMAAAEPRIAYSRLLDLAYFYRLLRGHVRSLLGAVAWPHLVHAFHCERPGLLATGRRLDLDHAVGFWRNCRAAHRMVSQVLMARGVSARGVLGAVPLIVGGAILAFIPYAGVGGLMITLLVIGSGLCGSIYVVCAPMIGEFTPVSQRGAVIAIYGAIYTLAGIVAPSVMGSVIQHAAVPLDGYMAGFTINAIILVVSGLLGLLLLWPNTERARLMAEAPRPKFA
jgi:MFS family permease